MSTYVISETEWVRQYKNATGERKTTFELIRKEYGSWGRATISKSYDKIINSNSFVMYNKCLRDLNAFNGFHHLTGLDLDNNQITDVGPLSTLTNLTVLYLRNNCIKDFSQVLKFRPEGMNEQRINDDNIIPKPSTAAMVENNSSFYKKIMERDDRNVHFKVVELVELIEDVYQMKFLYTMVKFAFRSGEINAQDHSKYIKNALSKTAQTVTCSDSIAHFKLILSKSKDDGVITQLESNKLDNIAEDNKTLNLPFIKDMHKAIQNNTARIEGLEANLESLNKSINELKRGMKRKLAVESSVGLVGAVLNAISFGVAGFALQGAMATTIGNIVDFGDYKHIQTVVNCSNDRELVDDFKRGKSLAENIRDSEIKDVLKLSLDGIELTADNKLGKTLEKETPLTIITAISYTVSNENHEGTIDIETSGVNDNNNIGDEEDNGFSEDEDETIFDLIDSNDLDGLRAMMDGYSNSEDLNKSFINEKKNALNSLKYAVSVKNSAAVDIIGDKAKDFGIITPRKFKKYQAESLEV